MKNYEEVKFNGKEYCVCCYVNEKEYMKELFVIDKKDLQKMYDIETLIEQTDGNITYAEGYHIYTIIIDGETRVHQLEEILLDEDKIKLGGEREYTIFSAVDKNNTEKNLKLYDFYDDDDKYRVIHISQNKYDNRQVNLQLYDHSEKQNCRYKSDPLPKNCGFNMEKLPNYVYYRGTQDGKGDMFVIELRDNNQFYRWVTTDSDEISLIDKAAECIKIIWDIVETYPGLIKDTYGLYNWDDDQLKLRKEYNDIISLSSYKCAFYSLVNVPDKLKLLSYNIPGISKKTKKYLDSTNTAIKSKVTNIKNNLPENCGVTNDMIPEHCFYKPKSNTMSDFFGIEYHPYFHGNKSNWCSESNEYLTTKEKYNQMMEKLVTLNPPKKIIYESITRPINNLEEILKNTLRML